MNGQQDWNGSLKKPKRRNKIRNFISKMTPKNARRQNDGSVGSLSNSHSNTFQREDNVEDQVKERLSQTESSGAATDTKAIEEKKPFPEKDDNEPSEKTLEKENISVLNGHPKSPYSRSSSRFSIHPISEEKTLGEANFISLLAKNEIVELERIPNQLYRQLESHVQSLEERLKRLETELAIAIRDNTINHNEKGNANQNRKSLMLSQEEDDDKEATGGLMPMVAAATAAASFAFLKWKAV